MPSLLVLTATPHRSPDAATRRLAEAYLRAARRMVPGLQVDTLDLFTFPLPPVDGAGAGVILHRRNGHPPKLYEERERAYEAITQRWVAADRYLIVTPMWNFGLPYPLKHYFDIILRPGRTFAIGPNGAEGLLTGRRADVLIARGFDYGPSSGKAEMNHLEPHLRTMLGFMGITDVRFATAEGTQLPGAAERLDRAVRQSVELALAS